MVATSHLQRIRQTIKDAIATYPRERLEARDRAHGDAFTKAMLGALLEDGGVRRRQSSEVAQLRRDVAACRSSGLCDEDELALAERELQVLVETVEGRFSSLSAVDFIRVRPPQGFVDIEAGIYNQKAGKPEIPIAPSGWGWRPAGLKD